MLISKVLLGWEYIGHHQYYQAILPGVRMKLFIWFTNKLISMMSPIFILIANGRINGNTHAIAHRTFSPAGEILKIMNIH